jgi:hypothetical protein
VRAAARVACIIAAMSRLRATPSTPRASWTQVLGVCVFAVAMAFVEAMAVRYLRDAVGLGEWQKVLEGRRSLPHTYVLLEQAREAATMVMLAAVGYLACSTWMARLGAFLLAFGLWDITYYVWLHLLSGFPRSLTTVDILFAIPSHWRGPVWVPTLIATGFVAAGALLMLGVIGVRRRTVPPADAGRTGGHPDEPPE